MALTAQQEVVVKALAGHANLAQFSAFMDALTPANYTLLKQTVIDYAKSAEQETALIEVADEHLVKPALLAARDAAKAALEDVTARWMAERETVQIGANEQMSAVNLAYQPELSAAQAAYEAAQAALKG